MESIDYNKIRLKKLMIMYGKPSNKVATLIATVTGDHLSTRTVQSWSASPGLVRARPCPGWALYILENELQILAEEKSVTPLLLPRFCKPLD